MINSRLFGRTMAVMCAAVAAVAGTAHPASAAPVTKSSSVIAGPQDARFAWHLPREANEQVAFTNIVSQNTASTMLTLTGPASPTTFAFSMDLPAASEMVSDGTGGYDLIRVTERYAVAVAHLDPPWARDAVGRSLPTSFSMDKESLVQSVDTRGATFPVTADPHYTWGLITGTVYFNKHETKLLAAFGTAASLIASLGGPWALLLRGYVTYIVTVAGTAIADGECLKIKSTLVASEYSGGYCT